MKQELQMNETQTNNLWDKFMNKMFNNHNYSTRRKIYNSMWSILLGLFITILIISFFISKLVITNAFTLEETIS